MKTLSTTSFALFALLGSALAQLPSQPTIDSAKRDNGAVREGFTMAGGAILVTIDGVTEKVTNQYVLTNGDLVYPNGDVRLYTGALKRLHENQLLTLDGSFEDVPVSAGGVAPVIPPGVKGGGEVGVSSRDGITVSGADTLITRNGVTDKVTGQLRLSNGVRINPDGTFMTKDGAKLSLRENQVLGFDGVLHEARISETGPVVPSPAATGNSGKPAQ